MGVISMAYIKNNINYGGPGIYMLKSESGYTYIGKAKNVAYRLSQHNENLKTWRGLSNRFKEVITKEDVFEAIILEQISYERSEYYLKEREKFYIDKYNALGEFGLNTISGSYYLHDEINRLCNLLKEYDKRVVKNTSEERSEYTDYFVGVTEANMRCAARNLIDGLSKLREG